MLGPPVPFRSHELRCFCGREFPAPSRAGFGMRQCVSCGSAWVSNDDLPKMLQTARRRDKLDLDAQPKGPGKRGCPVCQKPMQVLAIGATMTDHCAEHGHFFDKGELTSVLLRHRNRQPDLVMEPVEAGAGEPADDGVELGWVPRYLAIVGVASLGLLSVPRGGGHAAIYAGVAYGFAGLFGSAAANWVSPRRVLTSCLAAGGVVLLVTGVWLLGEANPTSIRLAVARLDRLHASFGPASFNPLNALWCMPGAAIGAALARRFRTDHGLVSDAALVLLAFVGTGFTVLVVGFVPLVAAYFGRPPAPDPGFMIGALIIMLFALIAGAVAATRLWRRIHASSYNPNEW